MEKNGLNRNGMMKKTVVVKKFICYNKIYNAKNIPKRKRQPQGIQHK